MSQVLQLLCTLDKSSPEFLRSLYTFIRLDENGGHSSNLQKSEPVQLVNLLDETLDVIPVTDALFRRCLRWLRLTCGHHNVLPSSYIISKGLSKVNNNPVAYGGFADVWEGIYQGEQVCIKVLRIGNDTVNGNDQKNSLALFYGEAVVWKRLRHPNVVRFLGVTTKPLQIVSEWMSNGTLPEYVKNNPSVDRLGLLLDVAEGVNYLHTCHTFHGDLKGPNILVDDDGHARVSDFGLASIAYGKYSSGIKSDKGRTVRWSAPEVLSGASSASKPADMFAFGMVVVEVFTGNVPFHNMVSTLVSFKTMNGERPPRPHGTEVLGLSDALWKMTETCWQQDPIDRLVSSEVVDLLREMYVTSPSNPLVNVINSTQELWQSGLFAPQTDPALSPKLLNILQHHKQTLTHKLSDTIPLNNEGEITVGRHSQEPGGPVGHQTPGQYPVHGTEQRLEGADQDHNFERFPQPLRSETFNTVESDVWETAPRDVWPMVRTIPPQRNLNQVLETVSGGGPRDTTESPVAIPKISVQDSDPSNTSSPRVVDIPDYQAFTPTEDVGTDGGTRDSGKNVGDDRTRKVGGARKPGSHRPRSSGKSLGVPSQDFPSITEPKHGPASPGTEPIERTPSRSSSIRKALRGLGGLLSALKPGDGSSKPSTRSATPTVDRGEGPMGVGDIPPQKTSGAKRWKHIRGITKVIGLYKRA